MYNTDPDVGNTTGETQTPEPTDNVAKPSSQNIDTAKPSTVSDLKTIDNTLVTQATLASVIAMSTDVINKLAGSGLEPVNENGSVATSCDIRQLVTRGLHLALNESTVTYNVAPLKGEL